MFHNFEASAKLVMATQRDSSVISANRQPRLDRNFITKSGVGSPTIEGRIGDLQDSCSAERRGDGSLEHIGFVSTKFAVALMGAAAPVACPSDAHRDHLLPPMVLAEGWSALNRDTEGLRRVRQREKDVMTSTFTAKQRKQKLGVSSEREMEMRNPPPATSQNDFANCNATLANFGIDREAASSRTGVSTQAEGEKTSELDD
jgi:hypothetical protein